MNKVLVEQQGSVLLITINRPEARNAVDHDVCVEVGRAVTRADEDPSVRALVLTGAGDQAFSAGADLKALMRGERILPEGQEHWSIAGFANHFTSKPTIAAVNGVALGGGTELALSCDLIVAVETSAFGLPEVKRGLVAGAGGAFRLVQQLPHRIGLELLLTGDPLPAADALRWGLINRIAPPGDALRVALELAATIAANAPLAVQASKRIAYAGGQEAPLWDLTSRELALVAQSQDAQEGPRAFAEKRAPVWQAN